MKNFALLVVVIMLFKEFPSILAQDAPPSTKWQYTYNTTTFNESTTIVHTPLAAKFAVVQMHFPVPNSYVFLVDANQLVVLEGSSGRMLGKSKEIMAATPNGAPLIASTTNATVTVLVAAQFVYAFTFDAAAVTLVQKWMNTDTKCADGDITSATNSSTGTIYVTGCDQNVDAINVTSGKTLWKTTSVCGGTTGGVLLTPFVATPDGSTLLYTCQGGGHAAGVYATSPTTTFDLMSSYKIPDVVTPPVYDALNHIVYVVCRNGTIMALTYSSGTTSHALLYLQSFAIGEEDGVVPVPVLDPSTGTVYAAGDFNILAMRKNIMLWNVSISNAHTQPGERNVVTMSLLDGVLFLGSREGYVVALNATTTAVFRMSGFGGITKGHVDAIVPLIPPYDLLISAEGVLYAATTPKPIVIPTDPLPTKLTMRPVTLAPVTRDPKESQTPMPTMTRDPDPGDDAATPGDEHSHGDNSNKHQPLVVVGAIVVAVVVVVVCATVFLTRRYRNYRRLEEADAAILMMTDVGEIARGDSGQRERREANVNADDEDEADNIISLD